MKIKQITKKAVKETVEKFKSHPNMFLTEDDIRCYLVSRLLQHKEFSTPTVTADGSSSIPVHSEVRWYGNEGRLKYRSDIVILDVSTLQTGKGLKLPSKGFAFNKFHVVIELKLRRRIGNSDNKYTSLLEEDFEKLKSIRGGVNHTTINADYYIICFDKKKDITSRVSNLTDPDIDFRYIFKSA